MGKATSKPQKAGNRDKIKKPTQGHLQGETKRGRSETDNVFGKDLQQEEKEVKPTLKPAEKPSTKPGGSLHNQKVKSNIIRQQRVAYLQNPSSTQPTSSPVPSTSHGHNQNTKGAKRQRKAEKSKKIQPKVEETKQPKEFTEDNYIELLSSVLDAELRRANSHTSHDLLQVHRENFQQIIRAHSSGDAQSLPSVVQSSDLSRLMQKRTPLEFGKTISFGCRCWNTCSDRLRSRPHPVEVAVLEHIQKLASNAIITCLIEVIPAVEETFEAYLWAGIKTKLTAIEGTQLLKCIANWDDNSMSPEFLHLILKETEKLPQGHLRWVQVIRSAGTVLRDDDRLDEIFFYHAKMLAGLEKLLKTPTARFILSRRLKEELEESRGYLGAYFETESVLGLLLALTTVPTCIALGANTKSPTAALWSKLRGFPKLRQDDLLLVQRNLVKSRQQINSIIASGLKEVFKSDCPAAIEWLSQLLVLNELRTIVTPKVHLTDVESQLALSDGFMLNLCYVLVELCLPFCGDLDKVAKLDPSYPTSPACHLGYSQETGLASGLIFNQKGAEDDEADAECPLVSYNFMTQIFHLTLRAFNIGFMPALKQFRKQTKILFDSMKKAEELNMGEQAKAEQFVHYLQWKAHLMDFDFVENGTRFYLTVCLWIKHLLKKATEGEQLTGPKARRREQLMLQQVPEFVVKDLANWFTFAASYGLFVHRHLFTIVSVNEFVECCMMFLNRRDLLPNPIPASTLCQTLLQFVSTSDMTNQWGVWNFGGMSNLELAVQTCAATQNDLCPSLILTYVSVDVVEGLDLDKDDFDKFSSRSEIGRLLVKLWDRMDCRQSILKMCGTKEFQSFLGAIFDTLLHQLHDSLARLANVRKLELAKPSLESLSGMQKQEKVKFLKLEQHMAEGFMKMATETVDLLELVTKSDDVARCLTVMPLAQRAASAFVGFLESLCGSRSVDFKVKDMKKYNWVPQLLLIQLTGIVQQIVKQEESKRLTERNFTISLATDPDFNLQVMTRALQVLKDKTIAKKEFVDRFREVVDMLCDTYMAYSTQQENPNGKLVLMEELDMAVDQEQLNKVYAAELGPLCYDAANILETHAFQSYAATMPVDARSKLCQALMKETRMWMTDLPVQAQAAIFLRQDENRMDVVRAVITGPEDTPYSLGCFVFDLYFPPTYPDIPPLVKFTTTGGGTVRFNPNLYADGKVCLSLLGTWHGGDSSQKWQPGKSSLYQVLMSVQSLILISTPMYNEPGYEGIQGTPEGDTQSCKYNATLRLRTLRHAMLSQLRRPPAGFEKVIQHHFFYQRDMVKRQCHRWLSDTNDPELRQKMVRVVEELVEEMDQLDLQGEQEEEEEGEEEEEEGEEEEEKYWED